MGLQAVTDKDFNKEVIESEGAVLVDFWAEWCGPCQRLMPVVEEIAGEMAGKLKIVKVNIEEAPEAPSKYGVRGIPALMLFKDGEVAATKVGAAPKTKLIEWVEACL